MSLLWIFLVILQYGFSSGKASARSSTKYNRLPAAMTLELRYSRMGFFTFNLEKIPENVDKVKVVVGDEKGTHVSPQDPNKHYSIYKDRKFYATFTVTDTNNVYTYYGSFRVDQNIYTLEPIHPNEVKADNAFDKDYIVTIDSIKYHLRMKVDTTHGGVDKTYVPGGDTGSYKPGPKNVPKKYIGNKQVLTIEVLVILDYTIYTKWMRLMDNNKYKAIEHMKYYFSEIVNGIRMRYENIEMRDFMFTVALAGFYIAETRDMVPFIENSEVKTNNVVDSMKALVTFSQWIAKPKNQILPRFDVAALFTDYQMPGINGLAYISGVCVTTGVSLNRDNGPFSTADTAAHEIGHNVGSSHDGDGNNCIYQDQFIMAAGRSSLTEKTYDNPFHFSKCSLGYFLTRLHYMNNNRQNCLEDYPQSDEPVDSKKFFNGSFGQTFSFLEQCRIVFGPQSRVCSRGHKSDSNLCFAIGCYDRSGNCASMRPAFGTSCAKNSWCIQGKCVKDKNAPTFKDYCRLGDATDPINMHSGRVTCKELIYKDPYYCSKDYYKDLCCESCGKFENSNNKNCPFGDRHHSCDSKYCGSPFYKIVCCKTCGVTTTERLPEATCDEEESLSWCRNPSSEKCYHDKSRCCIGCAMHYDAKSPDCEYGDKGNWCEARVRNSPKECQSESISKPCCKSCKIYGGQKEGGKEVSKSGKSTPTGCQDSADCSSISSWQCYSLEDRCCASCKRLETKDKKCKYGDHATWCKEELKTFKKYCSDESNSYASNCCETCKPFRKPKNETKEKCVDKRSCNYVTRYSCYDYEKECCATCKRLRIQGNKKDCRYGDRFDWCRDYVKGPLECQTPEYFKDCCYTCSPYANKQNQRG